MIKSRLRDWIVEAPMNGFLCLLSIDRSASVDVLLCIIQNAIDIHPELMKNTLGCTAKETSAMQKEKFQYVIQGLLRR